MPQDVPGMKLVLIGTANIHRLARLELESGQRAEENAAENKFVEFFLQRGHVCRRLVSTVEGAGLGIVRSHIASWTKWTRLI